MVTTSMLRLQKVSNRNNPRPCVDVYTRSFFLRGFEMKLSKVATRLKRNRPKWRIALGKGIKPRFFKRHEPEITKVWISKRY